MSLGRGSYLALLLIARHTSAQSLPCPQPDSLPNTPSRVQYCLTFKVVNGKLAVDQDKFTKVSEFTASLTRLTLAQAERDIRSEVAELVAQLPRPYEKALAPGESDPTLTDSLTDALRKDQSWSDYVNAFRAWAEANPDRQDLGFTFSSALFSDLITKSQSIGLLLNDQLDAESGYASFSVLPAFDARRISILLPGLMDSRRAKRVTRLRKALRQLKGRLWSSNEILSCVRRYYARLGLSPESVVTPQSETIEIIEGQRIESIILPPDEVPPHAVDRLLWDLLDTRDFRRAMRTKSTWETGPVVDFRNALGYADGDEPYLVQSQLQEQQLLLSQLGYAVTLQPSRRTARTQYLDLRIEKAFKNSGADKPEQKDRPRRIAGGVEFKPGQRVNALGLLQFSRLGFPFQGSTFSVQGGGPTGALWSGNYFVDFLNFERFHQRVALRLNASDQVQRQRFLAGRKVDETRIGGSGRIEWQPFRDLAGVDLLLHLEASHASVAIERNTGTVLKQNLNVLEMGAMMLSRSVLSEHQQRTRVEPRIIVGTGLARGEPLFFRAVVTSNTHRVFDPWQCDFTTHIENATRNTPVFELPSLGGPDTVRGFRADDAIGRRLWSIQNELWHPVPGFEQTRLDGLRAAAFFDAGGAYQTTASRPGLREGVGLGVRLDLHLAVLKFDWAYGFGEAATGGSRGKFYFSVRLNVPY
jgi:surface antigen Omp85-like protein